MDDAEAIRNLLGTYGERIDQGDFDAVGQLFTHGALADERGRVLAEGPEAVAAFYRAGTQLHDGSPRTTHQVSGTILEVDPDGRGATARSTYVVLQQTDELPLQPIITGRYHDRFSRRDGGWHFAERRFSVTLVGELRHHLAYELPAPGPSPT
ncbi:MAG: nuclear transport factor 2 family protein [Acidimicrobiales bacterium]